MKPKLSIVYPVLNQFELFKDVLIESVLKNCVTEDLEIVIIDNGSDEKFEDYLNNHTSEEFKTLTKRHIKLIRNEKNTGLYPTIKQGFEESTGDIIAYLHSDLFVYEKGWDQRIIDAFNGDIFLGLAGFIGSSEIDSLGGRGLGTMSNFQGIGRGSKAEIHGKRIGDSVPSAVVDGCSMIFRRKALEDIGFIADFPPHHFYDRVMGLQLLEKNWHIITIGIACDHISGQTANQEQKWHDTAREWANSKGIYSDNYDNIVYREAEKLYLGEWRDKKHFIPCRVEQDFTLTKFWRG